MLLGGAGLACSGLLALSIAGRFWTAAPALFLTGFAGVLAIAGSNTAMQLAVPEELRGRVTSLYNWVYGGTYPLGAFLTGALSERYGVAVALRAAGVTGLVLLALLGLRAGRARPPRPRPEPG
jgi:MFS family permease